MDPRQEIITWARAHGVDPVWALAVAERESSFNPNAGGAGSIRGLYQMTGKLRQQYGIPENGDIGAQTKGFAAYTNDLRKNMTAMMGREPTQADLYMGHHFGPYRAARMATGRYDPNTPVDQVFTARELQTNPHIVRAGTTGALSRSITTDMERRFAKHGGAVPPRPPADVPNPDGGSGGIDFSEYGAADAADFSEYAAAIPAKAKPATAKVKQQVLTAPEPAPTAVPQVDSWIHNQKAFPPLAQRNSDSAAAFPPPTPAQVIDPAWTTPLTPGASGINPQIFGV